ncbi:hypothetical protein BKA62DRAFT_679481 [Auriculariales sp. MPI-PUGE-AT-0066]|nr:hypothetical protein BKA62DRAFT_679481 [Auriculariales sp. MPI-PUGE-AT-0066]
MPLPSAGMKEGNDCGPHGTRSKDRRKQHVRARKWPPNCATEIIEGDKNIAQRAGALVDHIGWAMIANAELAQPASKPVDTVKINAHTRQGGGGSFAFARYDPSGTFGNRGRIEDCSVPGKKKRVIVKGGAPDDECDASHYMLQAKEARGPHACKPGMPGCTRTGRSSEVYVKIMSRVDEIARCDCPAINTSSHLAGVGSLTERACLNMGNDAWRANWSARRGRTGSECLAVAARERIHARRKDGLKDWLELEWGVLGRKSVSGQRCTDMVTMDDAAGEREVRHTSDS